MPQAFSQDANRIDCVDEKTLERLKDRRARRVHPAHLGVAVLSLSFAGFVKLWRGRRIADGRAIQRTRKALHASEDRLRLAADAANLGVFEWNAQTDETLWENQRIYEIFGRTLEMGPVSMAELAARWLHPDDVQGFEESLSWATRPGRVWQFLCRIMRSDRNVRWLEYSGRFGLDPCGEPIRLLGVVLDVTERQSVSERLERSESQLRLITDAIPAYIAYVDTNLRYVFINRTYQEAFGKPLDEIVGHSAAEVLGESYAGPKPYLKAALAGLEGRFETRMATVQGERILSVVHIPDRDSRGRVRGIVIQGHDITERKLTEEALRTSEKLAVVGRLAASIAHEINNPLESVTNLLFLARSSQELGEVQEYLDTAERELRRVSVIANQTLRFHKQSTNRVEVTCDDLIESVLAIHQGKILNSRVKVEVRMRASQPVMCFAGEIRQVLNNLIGNAIDAMHPGGGRLLIRSRNGCDWRTGQSGLMVTVADTGTGMDPETAQKIFAPFFTTKGIGGTGLGLWVSQEIVERHRGDLRVRSSRRPGRNGTAFTLFLPHEMV
ncbi:MAG: sensor signal transduction histidine kinase [Acidobacteriaceae bacterium]|nr:sensor signal transduction histidine kinase [Acidobacteriaceae bacterium]